MNGSIRPRAKGTWQLRYDAPADGTGKRRYVSETVKGTKAKAQTVLRERLAALESGTYVNRSKETVGRFLDSWVDGYAVTHTSPRTLVGYKGNISRYIVPALGLL